MRDQTTARCERSQKPNSMRNAIRTIAHKATTKSVLASPTWTLFVLLIALLFSAWCILLVDSVNHQQRVVKDDVELVSKLSGLRQSIRELGTWAVEPGPRAERPSSAAQWQRLYAAYRERASAVNMNPAAKRAIGDSLARVELAVTRMNELQLRLLSSTSARLKAGSPVAEFHEQMNQTLHQMEKIIQLTRTDLVNQSLNLAAKHGSLRVLMAASIVMATFIGVLLLTLKRTYIMLWKSEARLRLLLEQLPAVLWTTDRRSRFTSFMGSGLSRLNIKPHPLVGVTPLEHLERDDLGSFSAALQHPTSIGDSASYEVEWKGRTFQAHVEPLQDIDNSPVGNIGIALDITKRKRAEQALAAEKEKLTVTLQSIGDGVITTDTEGRIVLINKVAAALTGWSQDEAAGSPLGDVFHVLDDKTRARCENPVERVLKTGGQVNLIDRSLLLARDGTERIIADSGAPIRNKDGHILGVVLVFRDITEREKMEEELRKASKLESLSILAGGIAHDFNNILAAILANVCLAKLSLDPATEAFEMLTEAEKVSLRARGLTQQLLTFSKGGTPIKEAASISELIRSSTNLILRGSNVRCQLSLPADLWPVEIDQAQMTQVLHNLIINAKQAMPEGGVIGVRAENVTLDAAHAPFLQAGEYIKISVEDHGVGISEKHAEKIFDPFFTTKQDGNGLGLASTYSIIKNHDGHITVESELGVGTTFTLYLPASPETSVPPAEAEPPAYASGGRVLVMDDEQKVRESMAKMLKHMGYEVDLAKDGDEAIGLYQKAKASGRPFDVVIMDLTVPGGMGGKEAIRRLREIDPRVKAVVCSGYSNDHVMSTFEQHGFRGYLTKPYTIQELSRTLHQVVSGNGATSPAVMA